MTNTKPATWRELQARNKEAYDRYLDEALVGADDETIANLAIAHNADN